MGDFRGYNDYELLYLARMNTEEALEILIWKYNFLIESRIKKLKVPKNLWDDYIQEGNITLLEAIKIYDERSRQSFTNFFDMLLKRRIITLLRKEKYPISIDEMGADEIMDSIKEECPVSLSPNSYFFSDIERKVYELYFFEGKKNAEIAKILNISSKNVANAKQRVIHKIREFKDKSLY